MPLAAGTRLGVFEILSLLGKGGMGEVYRAKDTKLEREVAVKILPEQMAERPERMVRFEREAKLLAALDHPHIAAIHGLHEEDGQHFLVMELVDGQTLADRLKRGALPVPEALELGRQIAEALEAAHEKDIIHRDLKPSNVMLTSKGRAKVLDFGLARAMEREALGSGLNTETTPDDTGTGIVVGTAPYMSPEQIRGERPDQRVDVWAMGCVLYECLSGQRAFAGRTFTEVTALVLTQEPEWGRLPSTVPPLLVRLVKRCLRKELDRRIQHAGDLGVELLDIAAEPVALAPRPGRAARLKSLPTIAAAALGAALVFAWSALGENESLERRVARFTLPLPEGVSLVTSSMPRISADGRSIAFNAERAGRSETYLRRLDDFDVRRIEGVENAWAPFFSPDGKWLAMIADGALRKVPVEGGRPQVLAEADFQGGGTWGPDGTIVLANVMPGERLGLWRLRPGASSLERLTQPRGFMLERPEQAHVWPRLLPGGDAVLFTNYLSQAEMSVELLDLTTGQRRELIRPGCSAFYAAGNLIYSWSGDLFAVRFDLDRKEVLGDPVRVLRNVVTRFGGAHFDVAADGTLFYANGTGSAENEIVWVDLDGRVEALEGVPRTVVVSPAGSQAPVWSPDGRTIYYRSALEGSLWATSFHPGEPPRVGEPRLVVRGPFVADVAPGRNYDIHPDGTRFLILREPSKEGSSLELRVVVNWAEES